MDAIDLIESTRKACGMSLRAAASMAGISEGRWRQIVKSKKGPGHTVGRMALSVGLSNSDAYRADSGALGRVIEMAEGEYLAAQDMRHRIAALATERIDALGLSPTDIQERAQLPRRVVQDFLSGSHWPTEAQLDTLAGVLDWDEDQVKNLVWSGKDPGEVTNSDLVKTPPSDFSLSAFESLFGRLTTPMPEGDAIWKAEVERRLSRLERALIDYLTDA